MTATKFTLATIVALLSLFTLSHAQITSNQSGNWNDPNTWVGGTVPTSGAVIIATGHNVTYNANFGSSNSVTITTLTINGTGVLRWPFSDDATDYAAPFTLICTGLVTVASTASITNLEGDLGVTIAGNPADRTHQFNMRGGLSNAGTFDMTGTTTARRIDVDFQTNTQTVSGTGTFSFYNLDINGSSNTTTFSSTTVTIDNDTDIQNGSTLDIDGGTFSTGPDIVNALDFAAANTTFRVRNSAVVNIRTSATTNNSNALVVNADNCTFDMQGGTVNIGNSTTTGEGRFRINNAAVTDFSLDISGGVVNVADFISFTTTATCDFNITGGTLNVGTGDQGGETNSTMQVGSTFTVDGATAAANFGENPAFNIIPTIDNGATFSVGTNASQTANFNINSNWTIDNGSTFTADAGLNVNATFSLTIQGGSILNVESASTSYTQANFQIFGTVTLATGTINVGGAVVDAGAVTQDGIQIEDGGILNINDGTLNIFNNAGLTNGSIFTQQGIQLVGATNGTLNIGDGAGSANTAIINIATNLASQSPLTEEQLFLSNPDEGLTTVNSDGTLNLGGGNIGSLRLDDDDGSTDVDFHFVVAGGTVNIAGAMDVDEGAGFQQTGGTVNVGLSSSSGINDLDLGGNDPTSPAIFEVTGGTFNVGDGSINISIGNNNGTPAFASTTAFHEIEVTGGTVNINGRLQLEDHNARLILGGSSTLNFNPQSTNSLDPDQDILWLRSGIVDITGPVNINFLNPHSATGTGHTIEIDPQGITGNSITSSTTISAPVDFSNVTWGFGDGTESSNGVDGFDLDIATGHTSYGNFVINNPSGTGRDVVFTTSSNSYLTENITITAGALDVGSNNLDDDGAGSTLLIDANGTLKLDTDFPGTSTTNYTTYTLNTGSTVEYNGTATVANAQVPDASTFTDLIVSGTGTKTLNGATTVNGTLTLTNGTLAAGTNLTMGAASTISRSAGAITGDIQGTADYTIEYTGLSKSIDDSTDPEWTGGGAFDLNVNLTAAEILTLSGSAIAVNDLAVTEGILTDASALTHTVGGNLTMNTSYTGVGTISITGGTATHTLSSTGTATFSNLTMNDASFDASGDLDLTVTGTLTLTAGDIQVTSGTVTLNGATISGGSSTSYIAFDGTNSAGGMKQTYNSATDSRTFPIGTTTEYTPATIALTAASGFGELTIVPVASGAVFTLDGSNIIDLDYHWQVSTDGSFTGITANHTYNYDETDIRGVEGSYLAARYNVASPSWSNSDDTADGADGVNTSTNTITLTGTDFVDGHFTAGEVDEFSGVITTFYLRSDLTEPLDWNDGTNWTNTDGGTTPVNRTPGTNTPVVINRIVNVDADAQSAGAITIDAAGTIIIGENGSSAPSSGHSFGTVSGTGTLRIISDDTDNPTFPDENGGNWSNFLGASGGTVEYSGNGSYTLPSDVSSYFNLIITGTATGTKTLGNVDLTIHNNFSVTGANTVTAAISDATNGNITIGGAVSIEATNTLSFGSTNARTVTVTGSVTNSGTLNVANSGSAAHSMSVGGSLNSNGTTDMNTGGSTVDVTFTGSSNETVTIGASGSVDFNRLIVNKGTSQATTLDVVATAGTFTITDTGSGVSSTSIDLQNGTLILSESATITANSNGDWTIPSTAKLDLNSGSPTVQMTTSSAGSLLLNGSIQVSSGILNIGNQTDNATDNSIRYDGTTSEIIVDGGILNVGGAIRPNVTDGTVALDFTLSSGTVSLARNTSTNNISATSALNRSEADLSIDNAASSFTMSGGVLEIVRAESSDGKAIAISNAVTTYTVTGGTINILRNAHDAFSSNSTNAANDVGIYSNVPFWNLQIGDGDYPGDIGNANTSAATNLDWTILNDLTININNTTAGQGNFDMFRVDRGTGSNEDGLNINLGGTLTITDGTFEVNDDGTGGTITFNGSGLSGQTSPQVINNNGETLGDITINNTSGSVDLSAALTIAGDWTYTAGTFNQAANLVTMTTNVGAIATTINGNASFDDITLSNTAGVSLAGGDMTIVSGGVLTLSASVIFDIGDNGLTISEQSAGGITITTPSATNMIRVSGSQSAKGVTRTYPDATTSNFLYPVGVTISATDYYIPAQIDLTAGGGAGSTATIVAVASQHPLITDAENALNVYWQVTETGFDDTQTANHTYTYGTTVADIVEGADDTNFLDAYNAGTPTFAWTEGSTTNVSGQVISFTDPGADNIAGDFSAGVDAAFNSINVFYTIRDGDWDNTSATTTPWTNDACGGPQTEVTGSQPGSTNPVIVCSGNTVTITTTTGLNASAIEISGTLTSQVADISTIGDIDGTGTLEFTHTTATTPVLGSLSATFIGASGGSIDFGGTMDYTLPTGTTYNNLTISNTGAVTLPSNITVNGNATFNGNTGTVNMGGFVLDDADNGGTFTLGTNTTLDVDAANNFPSNFNMYTLDASSTVDYSLDNSAVQTVLGGVTYGNLTLSRATGNPAQKSLSAAVTIAGDLDIGFRTELLSNNHTITLQGNWTRNISGNTNFDEGTGTVILSGGSNQTINTSGTNTETFYNLTINKSGGSNVNFGGNITAISVTNDLTVTAETLAMASVSLTVTGTFSTGASGTFTSSIAPDFNGDLTNAGTFTVPTSVNLAGNFSNTGTYTTTSNTLVFDNTSTAQSLGGNATTFNNITVAKASGVDVTFNASTTVSGILALQNEGNVVLSSGNLIIPVSGSITGNAGGTTINDFSATRMIRTNGGGSDPYLVKNADTDADWDFIFPIGVDDTGNKYTPITVDATTDNITSGTLSVRSINGTTTDQSIGGSATTLNRHYDFDITGLTGTVTFDVLFQYDDSDVVGTEGDYLSAYSERSVADGWIQPVASMANTSAANNQFGASASLNGTIDFNTAINTEWTAGDTDLIFAHFYTRAGGGVDCGAITCDWTDGTNWTLTDGGTTAAGATPGSDNLVTISSGHTMDMVGNTNTASALEVFGTLNFAATNGHTLGDLTGTGTAQIGLSGLDTYVNTGAGSTFFGASGGTVEYNGDAAYTLPAAITEYNNLTIGGTTQNTHDKTLGVNTLVHGNLTLGTTDLENGSNLNLELRGSFSSGGGNFNVADGTFTFSNTATASLPSNLTFGSAGSLTLDNFGEKDLTGALVIENLTINSSSGTFDANSNTITVTGNWNNRAGSNLLTNPGTVTFNGADAQQIDGDNTFAATNISTSSTAVTVNSGTQTFTGALTLAASTSLDIGSNTIRVGNMLDVDAGTFTAGSGTVVYTSVTDPETQIDAITVGTLEIDKGGSTNTLDNDPATITFTNLVITNGEYDGPDLNIPGNFSMTSNGALDLTGITTMDVNGDLNNAATLNLSGLTSLNLGGSFTNTGTFTAPTTIDMDGASAQQINNDLSVTNFTKSGGGDVTLNANLDVSGTLTLTSGDIVSSTSNLLSLGSGGTVSGGSASSHVTSTMRNTIASAGATLITFPVGDGTNYRPASLSITQTDATSRAYTGAVSGGKAPALTLPLGIEKYSSIRYYSINQSPSDGITTGTITIEYGADDAVQDAADLRIIKSSGASYVDLGGTGSGAPAGTITSTNNFTAFSDFAIASTTFDNGLPVDLMFFDVKLENDLAILKWATASELNNDRFEIQRSLDGSNFVTISEVNGNGNSDSRVDYQFTDKNPFTGVSYYRLKQIDYDGKFEYSNTEMIENTAFSQLVVDVFPNPTNSKNINLYVYSEDSNTPIDVRIYDTFGRTYENKTIDAKNVQSNVRMEINDRQLTGLFLISIKQGNKQSVKRIWIN